MKIKPDTTIRIANAEAVSLELDVDVPITAVRLLPRFGARIDLTLEDQTSFRFPCFADPDSVKIEWLTTSSSKEAAFISYAEVVSRHYFSLDQLLDDGPGQDDFSEYSVEVLFAARQAATDVFEQASRRSFVHRVGRTKDYGRDDFIQLDHGDVYELLTSGYVQVSGSQLERDRRYAPSPYPKWIEYLYGSDTMPVEVSRAVLSLAAYTLRPSNRPLGATGQSSDAGYIHFTVAGRDGATAIPEVNAAIKQFGRGETYIW